MDYMGSFAFCCLILFAFVAGTDLISCSSHSVLNVTGVEGEAAILKTPIKESEARSIDWRYADAQMEKKIASFIHGNVTTDEDDRFNTRVELNTTAFFLKIVPLYLRDSGQYISEIQMNASFKCSQRFDLRVHAKISSIFLNKKSGSTNCLLKNSENLTNLTNEQTCMANSKFILKCWVEEGSNITFHWQKNGSNVTNGIRNCTPHFVNCSLLEAPIDTEDCNANYSCTAGNASVIKTECVLTCLTGMQKEQNGDNRYILGIIIGLLLLVVVLIITLCWKRKKKYERNEGRYLFYSFNNCTQICLDCEAITLVVSCL
ncbi:uncharacterized protein LOC122791511 [Protopterus annectens]|uniref:uncharacterized protein LOC122791511 n=1 Tax=Protopterus annectens TaxID=7888 RepID=UPI001CFB1F9D|nr:uncharacterized protein LOC122791511 [Protopterus annectens]